MILKKLTIQNFLSIKSITLNLENQGLVLLKGRNMDNESLNNNGAGKSSIIEALVYCLYGRTLRGLKGDAVVHRIPGKNMKIWLDLVDDNGDVYRIARYRKHSTNKNKSMLYRNGKDITPKSESDFNAYVADLLQADYLTFTSSLLYSAESFKFTSATDAEMKNTFDIMLGLDIYQKCLEIARNRLKAVESELSTAKWRIDDREAKIADLEQQIEDAQEEKSKWDKAVQEKRKTLQHRLDSEKAQLEQEQEELSEFEKKLDQLQQEKENAERLLGSIRKKLKDLEKLKSALQETKDDIQEQERIIRKYNGVIDETSESIEFYNQTIEKLRKKIDSLVYDKAQLDVKIGQPCPTCGQPMTEQSIEPARAEYDSQIQDIETKIEGYQEKIERAGQDIVSAQKAIQEAEAEIQELNETVVEFQGLIDRSKKLVEEKDKYDQSLQKAQEAYYEQSSAVKTQKSSISQRKQSIKRTEQDISELSKNNPYGEILAKYTAEKSKCEKEVQETKSGIQSKLDEQDCLKFWEQAYSNQGIKSYILDDITPFLNRRVNKYLSKLTSGHIEVKFNTQTTLKSGETREKFSIDISNQDGGQEYSANSGGERKRIDLSINLALQDLVASRSNKRINIAIFDEVFDALDEIGVEKVIELLQELSSEKSTILVVSHNQHLQSYFTNVVTVVKKDGFSTLSDESEEDSSQGIMSE